MIATDIPGVNEVVNPENGSSFQLRIRKPGSSNRAGRNPDGRRLSKEDYDTKFSYSIFLDDYRNFYQSMRKGSKWKK